MSTILTLLDPWRIYSKTTKVLTGHSLEDVTGINAGKDKDAAAFQAKLDAVGNPVVDSSSSASSAGNLGRAALITTSPQGVQGTDPNLRYRLLGNSSGLGN